MSQEDNQQSRKVNPSKLMVLTLLLTVPAVMTGCNQTSSSTYSGVTTSDGSTKYYNECEPDEDDCEYDSSHGVYVYGGSKKKKYPSSYKPSAGSKPSMSSGFGSGGSSSSGG